MSTDPLIALSRRRIIDLSRNLKNSLKDRNGGSVAIELLRRLEDRAAESLAALATCDEDPKVIRILQNEVKRYDEWVAWMQEVIAEGSTYDREETEEDREELIDMLMQTPAGYRQAVDLGLINEDQYSD